MNNFEDHISIGELAELTGISTHTLRIWEKRYGFPRAERLPSGHRRYPRREVPRLRAVNRALEAGFRISKIVNKNLEDLEKLLRLDRASSSSAGISASGEQAAGLAAHQAVRIEKWIDHVQGYSGPKLIYSFHEQWEERGPLEFIMECAVPFIHEIGERWCRGELDVAQEHFGSEMLYDFLGSMWRRLNERNTGNPVVLTTLPGETHRMGLQMCAVLAAWAGFRVIYLGPSTPIHDIAVSVEKSGARIVGISVSEACDPEQTLVDLEDLCRELGPEVKVLAGGSGLPALVPKVERLTTMKEFYDSLKSS